MTETTKNSTYLDLPGLQLYDSLIKAKMAADINTAKYNDADLKARVTTNENAIIVLNGTGEVEFLVVSVIINLLVIGLILE